MQWSTFGLSITVITIFSVHQLYGTLKLISTHVWFDFIQEEMTVIINIMSIFTLQIKHVMKSDWWYWDAQYMNESGLNTVGLKLKISQMKEYYSSLFPEPLTAHILVWANVGVWDIFKSFNRLKVMF